ncbi:MAG: hypothetical protein ACO1QS_15020 [Verrucomicrobiota bacterium]
MQTFAHKLALTIITCLLFADRPALQASELSPIVTPTSFTYNCSYDMISAGHDVWGFYYEPDNTWSIHAQSLSSSWIYGATGQVATALDTKMSIVSLDPLELQPVTTTNLVAASTPPSPWVTGSIAASYNNWLSTAETQIGLFTRGETNSTATGLFRISASADEKVYETSYGSLVEDIPIASENISIMGESLNESGCFYICLPDNTFANVTPVLNQTVPPIYTFGVGAERIAPTLTLRTSGAFTTGSPFITNEGILNLFGLVNGVQVTPSLGGPKHLNEGGGGGYIGHWIEVVSVVPADILNDFTLMQKRTLYSLDFSFSDSTVSSGANVNVLADGPNNQGNNGIDTVLSVDAPRFDADYFFSFFSANPPPVPQGINQPPNTTVCAIKVRQEFFSMIKYKGDSFGKRMKWYVEFEITGGSINNVTSSAGVIGYE